MPCPSPMLPVLAAAAVLAAAGAAAEHPGAAVYREHCVRCHGADGAGTKEVPEPLVGDRSVNQLAAYVDETMPEDDPSRVTGDAARQVAEYLHEAFYSAIARDRNRPARVELSRLTVRQHRNVVADVVGGFRGREPRDDGQRGLRAEYFRTRDFDRGAGLVFERVDPVVDFDFGLEGPDPEQFAPDLFAIRWTGAVVPPETGVYEFVVRTEQSLRLTLDAAGDDPPLIDAYVQSGDETEHRAQIMLLGGRPYPLTLEYSKANQGVDDQTRRVVPVASVRLLWKPPHGTLETVPERCLTPQQVPPVFVLTTPFPPDDKSIGYERGVGVSPEWFAAATAAAVETADSVRADVAGLAGAPRDAPDRAAKMRHFAATFAERAFRRPLTAEQRAAVIDRPFADAPDLDTALERSLLAVLGSPRFLYVDLHGDDPFATAARLSFGLWDSLPDAPLRDAAAAGALATPAQVRAQAERMVGDRRTRAKLRDFLFAWLRVDLGPEVTKNTAAHPGFSPEAAGDLRTSLELFLDDALWGRGAGDFRRLFTADEVHLNGRLAPLYGVDMPPAADFRPVRLDDGRRGGVLSHPYLMSVLAYADATSPIHRGVFLARGMLGNVLKPPAEAVAPLAPEQHPDLSTRERVSLQTSAVACQTCHTMINPLGFALEDFDAIGRHRTVEKRGAVEKPVDASGSYLPREGPEATFRGARELAAYVATSPDAHEAFVQALFHALVKQPVRAWGPDTLTTLCVSFAASEFDIRRLLVDIMVVAAVPPRPDATATASRDAPP